MANYTTNYNLKKPLETDFYDIEDFNGNMDKIDAEMKIISTSFKFTYGTQVPQTIPNGELFLLIVE